MNYQELFDAVQSYSENIFPAFDLSDGSQDTTTEQINRFIRQAEQRIGAPPEELIRIPRPNAPETEEDAIKAEQLRRLRVRRMFKVADPSQK